MTIIWKLELLHFNVSGSRAYDQPRGVLSLAQVWRLVIESVSVEESDSADSINICCDDTNISIICC